MQGQSPAMVAQLLDRMPSFPIFFMRKKGEIRRPVGCEFTVFLRREVVLLNFSAAPGPVPVQKILFLRGSNHEFTGNNQRPIEGGDEGQRQ
jgi:hypothetical protein